MQISLVGAGYWGAKLKKELENISNVDAVEIIDIKDGKSIEDIKYDNVVLATPAWDHYKQTMLLLEQGKNLYVEKPLAHNIWQLRTLKKAAKYYNIVSQMGNQGHTTDGIRSIKEWYEQGHLGQVTEVHAWHGKINFGPG